MKYAKFTMCIMKTINVKFIKSKGEIIILAEKTNELIAEVNAIKETMFNKYGAELFKQMNGTEFELFKKLFKIMDLSIETVAEQAITIQKLDKKLDKLLAK